MFRGSPTRMVPVDPLPSPGGPHGAVGELLVDAGPRLRAGLGAAYGPEAGAEATAEALAWGWEHADRVAEMENPIGYLYRVGQTAARKLRRRQGVLPIPERGRIPHIEPGLVPALESLSEAQRTVVLAVHAFGWTQQEVTELLDVSHSTVRTHLARAMDKLRAALEADDAE